MKKNIAYKYIRIVCRKLLIVSVTLFLIILILPLTLMPWTYLLEISYLLVLAIPLLGVIYSILMLAKPERHQVFWRLKKY